MNLLIDAKHKSSYSMGMNKLPIEKRVQILSMLCEGSAMRAIARVCDVSLNTVAKLLEDAGEACLEMHHGLVQNVKAKRIQCDEIWSFNYCKDKNVATARAAPEDAGSVWTWTALDSDSKLIVSYFIGDRSAQSAIAVMDDLRGRLANRVQLTTDGYRVYVDAVEGAFGGDVDYAMLVKLYGGTDSSPETRYSPAECIGTRRSKISGSPDMARVSTSHVERSNLSMRMHMRRFTRLTNAFSKKLQNHIYMVALYTVFYNFIRIHKTLHVTPAMAADISNRLYDFTDILAVIDAKAAPKPRGPYNKKAAA
jgi:IS1 family transposase